MNTQTRSHPVLIFAAFFVVAVLFTSACNIFTPRIGGFTQVVEISLNEQMFLDARPTFRVQNHDFWEDFDVVISRMELHDGFIRFLGTQLQADGFLEDCTIDVSLEAENGGLSARIIAMDIPGMTISDPLVSSVNKDLNAMLNLNTYSDSAQVLFQEVEVTEDALHLKILVNVQF